MAKFDYTAYVNSHDEYGDEIECSYTTSYNEHQHKKQKVKKFKESKADDKRY